MRNILLFPALGLLLAVQAACTLDGRVRETDYSACRVLASSDWKAEVEFDPTDTPIPYFRRKLVVTGKVTTASGYRASLGEGPVARLDDPVQQMMVRTEGAPDAGSAPVVHNVRAVVPAMKRYGGVAIRCGDGIIAEIREVPAPPRHKNENPWRF